MRELIRVNARAKRAEIRALMRRHYSLDIGVPALGESTLVTVRGRDFRAEKVDKIGGGTHVRGYFDGDSKMSTVLLRQIDAESLPELKWSIQRAIEVVSNQNQTQQ